MTAPTLPTVWRLTPHERDGKRCVRCGAELGDDAIRAGIAVGYWGAHNRSVAVYECPAHTTAAEPGDTL